MAIAIVEDRDHLEEIAPEAQQDPEVTDDVREMQRPVFYHVLERRPFPSGKPIATSDQTSTESTRKT